MIDDLKSLGQKVCLNFGYELIELDGEDDHIRLLVDDHPKIALSSLVNRLKRVASRPIRGKYHLFLK